MAISTVILNETTLMTVNDTTAEASEVLSGQQFYNAAGEKISGTIATKSAANLSASGSIVTVPSGYYASQVTKAVSAGTAGTPSATKGSVSNHSITITPTVTNSSGYIAGGTKTGTAVTVSASELVSGTLSISSSGSAIDVTNYSAVNVPAGSVSTPAKTITANPTFSLNNSTGVITATAAGSSSIMPTVNAGYINSGTTGTVSVSGSSNYQLTVQGAKTVTPTESEQTAVASYRFTTGAVKIAAISSTYVGSGVAQRSSANLTASGSIVTAPAGYYAAAATKSITAGSAITPATTITVTPAISFNTATGAVSVAVSSTKSVTPAVTAGYISSGAAGTITVSGSSSYNLTVKSSTDLIASGPTVTVPSGYYASQATKTIANGTAGTPSAVKGTVSNNSITITPTVINSAGYIGGGTKTGTVATVSASELVSGSETKTLNGTYDVTNLAQVIVDVSSNVDLPVFTFSVNAYSSILSITCDKTYAQCAQFLDDGETFAAVVRIDSTYSSNDMCYGIYGGYTDYDNGYYALYGPVFYSDELYDIKYWSNGNIELVPSEWSGEEGTPIATKGAVSNHSITITPSVVNTGGYIEGNTTITGTPVTVSASELVSGTKIITANGSGIDVTAYASVDVNVSGGGGGITSNIVQGTFTTGSTRAATGSATIPYTGTGYPIALMVYVDGGAYNNSTGGNTTWYNSVNRYDVGTFYMTKSRIPITPTYETSGEDNAGVVAIIYKNSTSSATTYTRTSSMTTVTYNSSSTNATTSTACIRFKGNGTTLSWYVGNSTSTTIGLAPNTTYAYIVVYSSNGLPIGVDSHRLVLPEGLITV